MSSFTVGIPCYNNARYIQSAIESADRADEVIVIDDASTDSSADIARNCGARVIVHETNSGSATDAYNELIECCTTDWLVLLSADDMLHSTTLAQVEAFGRDADWVWGNLDIIDARGHQYAYWDYSDFPRDTEGCIAYMRERKMLYPTLVAGFRMEWLIDNDLRAHHFETTRGFEDTLTGWRWLHSNPRLKYTQLPFALYRRHDASQTYTCERDAFVREFAAIVADES